MPRLDARRGAFRRIFSESVSRPRLQSQRVWHLNATFDCRRKRGFSPIAFDYAGDFGAKVSGCTVHFVDETLDGGPIVAQRQVTVCADDTVESLAARILTEEHKLYAEAVNIVLGTLTEN